MRTAARDPGSIDVRARPARGADVSLPQFDGRSQREIGGVPPVSPTDVRAGGRMIDSHGRTIRDLRISITDRCNFRCVYCM